MRHVLRTCLARRALVTATSTAAANAAAMAMSAPLCLAVRAQGQRTHGGPGQPMSHIPPELRAPPTTAAEAEAAALRASRPPAAHGADSHHHHHEQQQQQPPEEMPPPQKPTETPKFIKIGTNERRVTHIQLARGPVNSLNLDFLRELNQWLLWIGSNEESRALLLSSAIPTVFSAGIDIAELSSPQAERFTAFWQAYQELWLILNTFPKPIIGAITGNSPAGGCVMAMGCDYRIMARGPKGSAAPGAAAATASSATRLYRIGLNEVKLGIPAPAWVMPAYAYLLGARKAERLLQLGETPTADDALKLGLIDQVEEDEEKTLEAAYAQAERFLAVPQQSRWMARDMMRREYLQMLSSDEDRGYDTEFTSQLISSPEVQQSLSNYLDRLKGKMRK